MLICAEDGWVDDWSGEVPGKWNYRGCRKYQSIAIHCLGSDSVLMTARPEMPHMEFFDRLIWAITNRSRPVVVSIEQVEGLPRSLDRFKEHLVRAVIDGSDLLLQYSEPETLVRAIRNAGSYADLKRLYRENHWN